MVAPLLVLFELTIIYSFGLNMFCAIVFSLILMPVCYLWFSGFKSVNFCRCGCHVGERFLNL